MPWEKGNGVMSFLPVRQDSASGGKGVEAGGQQTQVRHGQPGEGLGSASLNRLWGKAAGVIIPGLGPWSEVAFDKETVNCHRSGVLEGGSNLFGAFENSVN